MFSNSTGIVWTKKTFDAFSVSNLRFQISLALFGWGLSHSLSAVPSCFSFYLWARGVVQTYIHTKKSFTNLLWINVFISIQVPLFKGIQWIFIVDSSIVCSLRIITELFIFCKCYDEIAFVFVNKTWKYLRANWSDIKWALTHFVDIQSGGRTPIL